MKHLILVGACYLDTILTVPSFPQEDSKLRATSLRVRRGGNCPNSLEVLLQLLDANVVKTHLVSTLPSASSASTSQILASFGPRSASVDFINCLYREDHDAPASSYIIRNNATGSRTIVNYNALPEMSIDEFGKIADTILATDQAGDFWWHFEGRIPETTFQCIRHLRRVSPQSTISVEVEKPNREGLTSLAAEADVVFYSRTWAESRGHKSAETCLRAEAASSKAWLMLCTWGDSGAASLSLAAGEYIHRPANPYGANIQVVE